jgi:hypothetical protein
VIWPRNHTAEPGAEAKRFFLFAHDCDARHEFPPQMHTKTAVVLIFTAAGLGFVLARVLAQAPARPSSAETSKILFENERTRVIEYHTNAGKNICGLGMHSHPAHLFIMLTDAKLRVVEPDGKESIENGKVGEVGWEPAVTHRAENLMGNNAGCYLIEFKDKDWKPSTGMTN